MTNISTKVVDKVSMRTGSYLLGAQHADRQTAPFELDGDANRGTRGATRCAIRGGKGLESIMGADVL
jgi:hypothetical protein